MSDPERIRAAISEARRYLEELPSPHNEANTCDWVIRPLLVALGYANHEIHAQASDVSNKFPDYTILPDSKHTWFLEAKTWTAALESQHVDQSMNYAHSNGRRWVVLSNGREWRLYDDLIPGKSADRLVSTARLDDELGIFRFLEALSRNSIVSEQVDLYASERRIRDYLLTAISDTSSPVVQAIVKVVKTQVANVPVSASAVVSILNAAQSMPEQSPIQTSDSMSRQDFYCRGKGADARGYFNGKGITILPGSKIRRHATKSYEEYHTREAGNLMSSGTLADRGSHFEVLREIEFKSPSGASSFALGSASNGWWWWMTLDGTMLRDIHSGKSDKD